MIKSLVYKIILVRIWGNFVKAKIDWNVSRRRFAGLPADFEPSTTDLMNAIDAHYQSEVDVIGMGENDAGKRR